MYFSKRNLKISSKSIRNNCLVILRPAGDQTAGGSWNIISMNVWILKGMAKIRFCLLRSKLKIENNDFHTVNKKISRKHLAQPGMEDLHGGSIADGLPLGAHF